tara:strand:- start:3114 stop:3482 length:369 start_codon:yes stop_codon:yes gene_type:complete
MAYALGTYARAICDRCGFDYPYLELKKEWNGLKTCSECWEPKHPQLQPSHHKADPEALFEPRPSVTAPTTGYGIVKVFNPVNSDGVSSPIMWAENSDTIGSSFYMKEVTGELGSVTITAIVS